MDNNTAAYRFRFEVGFRYEHPFMRTRIVFLILYYAIKPQVKIINFYHDHFDLATSLGSLLLRDFNQVRLTSFDVELYIRYNLSNF